MLRSAPTWVICMMSFVRTLLDLPAASKVSQTILPTHVPVRSTARTTPGAPPKTRRETTLLETTCDHLIDTLLSRHDDGAAAFGVPRSKRCDAPATDPDESSDSAAIDTSASGGGHRMAALQGVYSAS